MSSQQISENRIRLIEKGFQTNEIVGFLDELKNFDGFGSGKGFLSKFIRQNLKPFIEHRLTTLSTLNRNDLGNELPDLLLAIVYFTEEVHERVKLKEADVMSSVFTRNLFSKPFLDHLEPLMVRLFKYHFYLMSKTRNDGNMEVTVYVDSGEGPGVDVIGFTSKLQASIDELSSVPYLADFCRSSLVLAAHGITTSLVEDYASQRKTGIRVICFKAIMITVKKWLERWACYTPEFESTFTEYFEKIVISRLCADSFDIFIADYPRTLRLIEDLKVLMANRDWFGRETLLQNLSETICTRLLHVGVHTRDILKAYACAVESLIAFDESFVLVHKVCDMIKKYVKTRPDTVRTIIHFITAEKPGKYSQNVAQLVDKDHLTNVNDEYVIMMEEASKMTWDEWKPDPYDANPTESRLFRESADVFNMLVSIYGSRDLFVKEYQQLLANSLIAKGWGEHKDAEQKYLETMKKRFTDGELCHCEVMLKDIGDSERLFKFAVSEGLRIPFFPRIISSVFWPETKKDAKFAVTEPFKGYMDQFKANFEKKRDKRTINWYKDYGSLVKMDVKIRDCTLSVEAPLSFTQVLVAFCEKEKFDVDELADRFEMDKTSVIKRLEFWKEKGIISVNKENSSEWLICENLAQMERAVKQAKTKVTVEEHLESDEDEEEEIPIEEQVDALEQYWMYTKNLLLYHSSKDPLTPAKLVAMYKMIVAPEPPPSLEAVMMFMQRKVKLNLVVFENGQYKPDKDLRTVF
ncbi:unnamed protein product [Bursaphelenchus xylophilus]|uniref:(pine wood nematode) hypothetical protein n=1 Tax=Bursaphelenchus xylophilus TaxID=6326 RepID=A0A1I7RNN7_BURXY|nr:unnamed protein product [Bursaphelenchus xylophilus]CAG9124186.1 unnamed protein product [Bursaphelenchus xylophilus]